MTRMIAPGKYQIFLFLKSEFAARNWDKSLLLIYTDALCVG